MISTAGHRAHPSFLGLETLYFQTIVPIRGKNHNHFYAWIGLPCLKKVFIIHAVNKIPGPVLGPTAFFIFLLASTGTRLIAGNAGGGTLAIDVIPALVLASEFAALVQA